MAALRGIGQLESAIRKRIASDIDLLRLVRAEDRRWRLDRQAAKTRGIPVVVVHVYVAGPYSVGDVDRNVNEAIQAGDQLLSVGFVPFVPHLTHFWHALHRHTYTDWCDYDLQWLRRCDALLRLEGKSRGAAREVRMARSIGIPVFYDLGDLVDNKARLEKALSCTS